MNGPGGAAAAVPDVSLAVPCYNEEEVVGHTLPALVKAFQDRGISIELVVVDNGSSDRTSAILDELIASGLPAVKETVEVNVGQGYGILRGLTRCRGRYAGFICADGQVDPQDVAKLAEIAIHSKSPQIFKVRRRFRLDGMKRKLVSIAYNGVANVLFPGLGSIDINGNPKIFPAEFLEKTALVSRDWFLEAEVLIRARRLGYGVFEMNVMGQAREGGTSNVRATTCWEFVVNLSRARFGRIGRAP